VLSPRGDTNDLAAQASFSTTSSGGSFLTQERAALSFRKRAALRRRMKLESSDSTPACMPQSHSLPAAMRREMARGMRGDVPAQRSMREVRS
jgi:hypothetical protein